VALFYQHNINESTKLAIWKIEEQETFFLKRVPVKKDVSHPFKRLQHLAGRFLLPEMFSDFPMEEILIADTRKPFLPDERYHFSISHCGNYAAAIASSTQRVGIDIELLTSRIHTISPKFLNVEEQLFILDWQHLPQVHLQLTTILWSAKESIFKWYGNGKVDFRRDIQLQMPAVFRPDEWMELNFFFNKNGGHQLKVSAKVFEGLVLAYVVS
jgi:phosphopantetheinyl transferase